MVKEREGGAKTCKTRGMCENLNFNLLFIYFQSGAVVGGHCRAAGAPPALAVSALKQGVYGVMAMPQ